VRACLAGLSSWETACRLRSFDFAWVAQIIAGVISSGSPTSPLLAMQLCTFHGHRSLSFFPFA